MDSKFVAAIKEDWGKMLRMCAALVMPLYLDGPSDAVERRRLFTQQAHALSVHSTEQPTFFRFQSAFKVSSESDFLLSQLSLTLTQCVTVSMRETKAATVHVIVSGH